MKTIKKLLTGHPNNIQELGDYAKERDLPINILFKSTWEADQTGFQLIKGEIIYSIGTREEEIARIDKRFVNKLPTTKCLKTPSMNPSDLEDACEGVIQRLKEEAQSRLQYITSQGIRYQTFELNGAKN